MLFFFENSTFTSRRDVKEVLPVESHSSIWPEETEAEQPGTSCEAAQSSSSAEGEEEIGAEAVNDGDETFSAIEDDTDIFYSPIEGTPDEEWFPDGDVASERGAVEQESQK